jgi:hypothetical protein
MLEGEHFQEAVCWGDVRMPLCRHRGSTAHPHPHTRCLHPPAPAGLQVLLSNALGRKVYNLRQSINNVAAGILTLILLGELALSWR